jgi:tRNA (adenine37-N6)-methyltransferase
MLKEKKGVLATRSPHRPNPVGVTLARVEKIDKKTRSVLLSACDLVQGTPVLDIKPYVPNYDSVEPCRVPSWIVETINTRNEVIISQKARDSVMDRALHSKFKLYKNDPELFLKGTYVHPMCPCLSFCAAVL